MKGFELVFMASRSRRHGGKPVLDTVVEIARSQSVTRYTRRVDAAGAGAGGHAHSAHFFELADEPEEVMFILDEAQARSLVAAVGASGVSVFLLRRPVEYEQLGPPAA